MRPRVVLRNIVSLDGRIDRFPADVGLHYALVGRWPFDAHLGGTRPRSVFCAPDLASAEGVVALKLTHVEQMPGEIVWLRYKVIR